MLERFLTQANEEALHTGNTNQKKLTRRLLSNLYDGLAEGLEDLPLEPDQHPAKLEITVYPESKHIQIDGQLRRIPASELRLLMTLHNANYGIVPRQELLRECKIPTDPSLDVSILRLRKTLALKDGTELILTKYGVGYRLSRDLKLKIETEIEE